MRTIKRFFVFKHGKLVENGSKSIDFEPFSTSFPRYSIDFSDSSCFLVPLQSLSDCGVHSSGAMVWESNRADLFHSTKCRYVSFENPKQNLFINWEYLYEYRRIVCLK